MVMKTMTVAVFLWKADSKHVAATEGASSATSVTPNRVYYVMEWKWFGLKVTVIQWRGVNWSIRSAHLNGAFQYISVFFFRPGNADRFHMALTDTPTQAQESKCKRTQMCAWTELCYFLDA